MLIVAVVFGLVLGGMLALVVVSSFARVSIPELHNIPREPKQRLPPTPHAKHADRFPSVPPPLAPMSETPKVLGASAERVLPPLPPLVSASSVALPLHSSSPPLPSRPVTEVVAPASSSPPVQTRPPPLPPKEKVRFVVDTAQAIAADAELLQLLEDGHFIAAVQRYRKQHGVGVEEAKQALEAWRTKSKVNEAVAEAVQTVATDPQIVGAIRKGKIVEAIKLYRAKTGLGLQDAKAAIDEWRRRLGH